MVDKSVLQTPSPLVYDFCRQMAMFKETRHECLFGETGFLIIVETRIYSLATQSASVLEKYVICVMFCNDYGM